KNIYYIASYKIKLLHTDHKYIEALKKHDARLIEEIYSKTAPGIRAYLISKGAKEEEAGDVFQEALIDLYKLAQDDNFVLTCPLEAFLLLICKRKWINIVEKNARRGVTKSIDDGYTHIAASDDSATTLYADTFEKEQRVLEMLEKISERCREIIVASYSQIPQQQLAEQMGVSYAYLRKKKSLCMAELINLVRNHK